MPPKPAPKQGTLDGWAVHRQPAWTLAKPAELEEFVAALRDWERNGKGVISSHPHVLFSELAGQLHRVAPEQLRKCLEEHGFNGLQFTGPIKPEDVESFVTELRASS